MRIQIAQPRLYPSADSSGVALLNLFTQILVMFVIGFILVPLLLVEEKESRTMDMLMASPAGWRQLLAGKTLAGLAYCLCAGLVIVLINLQLIVHWEIMLPAVLLTSAFVVSAGLLIGSLANSPTSAAVWGSPLLILMVASVLMDIFPGLVPAGLAPHGAGLVAGVGHPAAVPPGARGGGAGCGGMGRGRGAGRDGGGGVSRGDRNDAEEVQRVTIRTDHRPSTIDHR